jgi:hypothetical protein
MEQIFETVAEIGSVFVGLVLLNMLVQAMAAPLLLTAGLAGAVIMVAATH